LRQRLYLPDEHLGQILVTLSQSHAHGVDGPRKPPSLSPRVSPLSRRILPHPGADHDKHPYILAADHVGLLISGGAPIVPQYLRFIPRSSPLSLIPNPISL
jgi:hypothetical protein